MRLPQAEIPATKRAAANRSVTLRLLTARRLRRLTTWLPRVSVVIVWCDGPVDGAAEDVERAVDDVELLGVEPPSSSRSWRWLSSRKRSSRATASSNTVFLALLDLAGVLLDPGRDPGQGHHRRWAVRMTNASNACQRPGCQGHYEADGYCDVCGYKMAAAPVVNPTGRTASGLSGRTGAGLGVTPSGTVTGGGTTGQGHAQPYRRPRRAGREPRRHAAGAAARPDHGGHGRPAGAGVAAVLRAVRRAGRARPQGQARAASRASARKDRTPFSFRPRLSPATWSTTGTRSWARSPTAGSAGSTWPATATSATPAPTAGWSSRD